MVFEMEWRGLIGQLFLEAGCITREQLELALLQQRMEHPGKRLGEILVELGFLTQNQMENGLAVQRMECWEPSGVSSWRGK